MIFWQETRNLGARNGHFWTVLAKPWLLSTELTSGRDEGGPQGGVSSPRHTPHLFCGEKRYRAQGSRLRQHSGLCGSSTFCSRKQQLWGGKGGVQGPSQPDQPQPLPPSGSALSTHQVRGQGATLGSEGTSEWPSSDPHPGGPQQSWAAGCPAGKALPLPLWRSHWLTDSSPEPALSWRWG